MLEKTIDAFRGHPFFLVALILVMSLSSTRADEKVEAGNSRNLTVEIAFATNRQHKDTSDLSQRFGDEIGPLSFGTCSVKFTPVKFLKRAARNIPIRFPTEKEDIVDLQQMDEEEFWFEVRQRVGSKGKKAVFYIHGYKMDFDKACRRAALMQRELGSNVSVLLFAWPSQDNLAMYTRDETLLKKSVEDIARVLDGMLETFGDGQVDVVGHSLGTRGVTSAIANLEQRGQVLFDELVLIAPDMDSHDFEDVLPHLSRAASGITMYVSENDSPLRISREVHGEPRIGEAGEYLSLFDGVETIDISDFPQWDIYGHNYHYFNEHVIDDLRQLFIQGTRAAQRSGLEKKMRDGKHYWQSSALK